MTPEEIETIAREIAQIDGECIVCVSAVTCRLDQRMPEVGWFEAVSKASRRWSVDRLRADTPCQPR